MLTVLYQLGIGIVKGANNLDSLFHSTCPKVSNIKKYINNQQMHSNIYDVLYSQYSHPTCFGQYSNHLQGDIPITRTLLRLTVTITP
jgi:hypothetical protein